MNVTLSFVSLEEAATRLCLTRPALYARLVRTAANDDGTYPVTPGVVGVKIGSHWRIRFEDPASTPVTAPTPIPYVPILNTAHIRGKAVDLTPLKDLAEILNDEKAPEAIRAFARHLLLEAQAELLESVETVKKALAPVKRRTRSVPRA